MAENDRTMARYAADWERNAGIDPLWAVLTDIERVDGGWDRAEFYATGAREIGAIFDHMAAHSIAPARMGRFIDFGCGAGRLSRALAEQFESGLGIDIARPMVETASTNNRDRPGLEFQLNTDPDLGFLDDDSIDFVCTHIVLQHMPEALQRVFIAELLRVLAPGGVAAFQIPTATLAPRGWTAVVRWAKAMVPRGLKRRIKTIIGQPQPPAAVRTEMHALGAEVVEGLVRQAGCRILDAPYSNSTDRTLFHGIAFIDEKEAYARARDPATGSDHISRFFFVTKPA